MKTLLKLLLIIAVAAYLVFAFTRIIRGGDDTKCVGLNVKIADSAHAGFITATEVRRLLDEKGLNPTGKKMEQVDGDTIEHTLLRNPFISMAKCYKSPSGEVNIQVAQRLPIMRIKADDGEDYYIDRSGHPMKSVGYTADVAVATGHISKEYARRRLVHLARFIHDHSFADDLVTQVSVGSDGCVALIPRIGCDVIRLGRLDSAAIHRQLGNLHAFYTKVLPTVGWNTYREISLEYANQIVCKKT